MTANLRYQRAKELNISDEDIAKTFEKKDPTFKARYDRALELGLTPEEIFTKAHDYYEKKKQPERPKEMGVGDYAVDVGQQGAQGFGIGSLGTYGDILDLFGLQAKETLPGEKAKYDLESQILNKMDTGAVPSAGELLALSDDDDIAPRFSRLPNSQEVEETGKKLGVVSEPKTAAGRYARRIGRIGGGTAALGAGGGITTPIVAGATGQTLEELGAPPWVQAAGEIVAALSVAPKTNIPVTSKSKEVEKVIGDLRKAGYSEKDLTLAKSALEEKKILKKLSSMTPGVENTIQKGIKNSEDLFKEQIKKGLPGYAEGGLPYLQKQANNVYGTMEELASTIPIKNKAPVKKSIEDAIAYLEKYPLLDEQKKFIEFMKDGLTKLDKADTAEFFTGFYRNLGRAGNWGDPKQKEHLLGMVKQGIKDTFAESGPEGAKFGKYFDKTNEAWKHWINTADIMETIEKAQNIDGMNFKKLSDILNKPENHELAKKVLGSEQLENIKSITQGADAIESLLKQIPKTDKNIQSIKWLGAAASLIAHDYRPMAALVGWETAKFISTQMLINPKYQNIMKKLITAAKNNSSEQAVILAQELVKESHDNAASQAK